jgi:GNAT superfamily N-acetyltransferase
MHSELTIRLATPAEKKPLEDLQRRASLIWEDSREALLAHPDAIDLPVEHIESGCTYVAECNGQIFGFSVILPRPDGNSELDGLFVEPSSWKQGTGRRLVEGAERLAASRGAKFLYVIGNPRARGFYESCHCERLGESQTRFGPGLTNAQTTVAIQASAYLCQFS